jgi:hypothetical protein
MSAAGIAAGAAGLGALIGAAGSLQEGQAAAQAASYNAKIADQNAKLAEFQAAEEERRQRVLGRKEMGAIEAAIGASGAGADSLSFQDVFAESARNAELDALTIRYGGQIKAKAFREEARLARMGGKNAVTSSYYGAASSLLSGGAQVASYTAKYKKR